MGSSEPPEANLDPPLIVVVLLLKKMVKNVQCAIKLDI